MQKGQNVESKLWVFMYLLN